MVLTSALADYSIEGGTVLHLVLALRGKPFIPIHVVTD
jgi:hypothetical protein